MNPIPFNSHAEDTPEARLAAVVHALNERRRIKFPDRHYPVDYADYREELRPYVERELLAVEERTHALYASAHCTAAIAAKEWKRCHSEMNAINFEIAKREAGK